MRRPVLPLAAAWLLACLVAAALAFGAARARADAAPPLVETGPAVYFQDDIAQVSGSVDAGGTKLSECYFEYGTTGAYGLRAEAYGDSCNPFFSLSAGGPLAVDGKLPDFSPGTVYHYRLVARNQFGLGIGADRTVGTSGDETPPQTEPGQGADDPQPSGPAQPGSPSPSGSTSPPAGDSGCPAVKLIGLRGSGEREGTLGRPVAAFSRALARELGMSPNDGRYGVVPLRYPAPPPASVVNLNPLDGKTKLAQTTYGHSISAGIGDLRSVLLNDPCRDHARYVLAGYSQGAQVIGDAISAEKLRPVRGRIAATVLFGDPKFDAHAEDAEFFGSFRASKAGLFAEPPFSSRRRRDGIGGYRVLSYCRRTDPFCQANLPYILKRWAEKKDVPGHEHYQDREAQQAAQVVASRLP